ncbi:MAG: ATP-binding protein [Planctomycetota bacterium]
MDEAAYLARFRLPASYASLRLLRRRLLGFLETSGYDAGPDGHDALALAVDEAAANIVRHGYAVPPDAPSGEAPGHIDVELAVVAGELRVRLWDDGAPQSPEEFRTLPPRTPGESGMGLEIMRQIMTELRFERTADERNLLEMRRRPGASDWSEEA